MPKSRGRKPDSATASPSAPIPFEVVITEDGGCTIGGMPVVPNGDEALHHCVLNYLHRLAMATAHPVRATVRDARSGFVTPIEVQPDGSSRLAGAPERMPERQVPSSVRQPAPQVNTAPFQVGTAAQSPGRPAGGARAVRAQRADVPPEPAQAAPDGRPDRPRGAAAAPESAPVPPAGSQTERPPGPRSDGPAAELPPPVPGTRFITETPAPRTQQPQTQPSAPAAQQPPPAYAPAARAQQEAGQTTKGSAQPPPRNVDGPSALREIPPTIAEGVSRINQAIEMGHIEFAATVAQQTLTAAYRDFGADHPHVLELRELSAHVAYLAGDHTRLVVMALEVAEARHRQGDPRAYESLRRAAAVWPTIRDPREALECGRELVRLWAVLVREGGPDAADADKLKAAEERMVRLAQQVARGSGR